MDIFLPSRHCPFEAEGQCASAVCPRPLPWSDLRERLREASLRDLRVVVRPQACSFTSHRRVQRAAQPQIGVGGDGARLPTMIRWDCRARHANLLCQPKLLIPSGLRTSASISPGDTGLFPPSSVASVISTIRRLRRRCPSSGSRCGTDRSPAGSTGLRAITFNRFQPVSLAARGGPRCGARGRAVSAYAAARCWRLARATAAGNSASVSAHLNVLIVTGRIVLHRGLIVKRDYR